MVVYDQLVRRTLDAKAPLLVSELKVDHKSELGIEVSFNECCPDTSMLGWYRSMERCLDLRTA